jgi:hypothetical protein
MGGWPVGQAGGGGNGEQVRWEVVHGAGDRKGTPSHVRCLPPSGTWLSEVARPQLEVQLRGAPHQLSIQLTASILPQLEVQLRGAPHQLSI